MGLFGAADPLSSGAGSLGLGEMSDDEDEDLEAELARLQSGVEPVTRPKKRQPG